MKHLLQITLIKNTYVQVIVALSWLSALAKLWTGVAFICYYVVSVKRGFIFLWVFGMSCVFLLWHSLSLPYNYFAPIPLETGRYEKLAVNQITCFNFNEYVESERHVYFNVRCMAICNMECYAQNHELILSLTY